LSDAAGPPSHIPPIFQLDCNQSLQQHPLNLLMTTLFFILRSFHEPIRLFFLIVCYLLT
jgi:hypothetical protein